MTSGPDPAPAARLGRRIAEGLAPIDAAFERARSEEGARVPCRRGCGACCAAVFDVHPADAVLLGAWLDAQPPAERLAVVARAREVLASIEGAARQLRETAGEETLEGWRAGDGLQALPASVVTRLAGSVGEPCPLLDAEGACRAHAFRPAVCRLQGLPWHDPATGAHLPDFCRLEAEQADLASRAIDLAALDGLRHEAALEARRLGLAVARGRTTVAEALVRWAGAGTGA